MHLSKTINSIVNAFSLLQSIKFYWYTSCLQLFYSSISSLQSAPVVIHNFLRKFSALFMQWYIQPTYPNFRNDSKTGKTFQMQFTYFRISSL